MALRTVRFDMNELARIAASAIGADRCVHVEKCPEDDFNKTYILRMDDGREVIGKVPNQIPACRITPPPARLQPWIMFVAPSFPTFPLHRVS
jgi:hypothetical protein